MDHILATIVALEVVTLLLALVVKRLRLVSLVTHVGRAGLVHAGSSVVDRVSLALLAELQPVRRTELVGTLARLLLVYRELLALFTLHVCPFRFNRVVAYVLRLERLVAKACV